MFILILSDLSSNSAMYATLHIVIEGETVSTSLSGSGFSRFFDSTDEDNKLLLYLLIGSTTLVVLIISVFFAIRIIKQKRVKKESLSAV